MAISLGGLTRAYKKVGAKRRKKKAVKKETARVQSEVIAGAKRADRGKKTEQVAKRVLPDVGSRVRKELEGMSAAEIANTYTGTQITAMMRKIKNPKVLAKLERAKKGRTRQGKKFIEQHQGVHHEGYPPVPRKGSRGAAIGAKAFKKGGTAKRKSGGKMTTDGNLYVASLYKGGKVGG